LLRAFHHGVSGAELNPMLYVSRAPWSICEEDSDSDRGPGAPP
jgi:hypothetical protein